ncbi:MAG: hypothetical protein WKF54_01265 [Nocardioidaceae bacterium]
MLVVSLPVAAMVAGTVMFAVGLLGRLVVLRRRPGRQETLRWW